MERDRDKNRQTHRREKVSSLGKEMGNETNRKKRLIQVLQQFVELHRDPSGNIH